MNYLKPETRTYFFQTLDPLHMGTGGTRLGRVDNTVARDPVTRLPKAPGTGISGAVKDAYDLNTLIERKGHNDFTRRCAGSKGCGEPNCRVCALFGSAPPEETASTNSSKRGIMAFRDALLVSVPVASITGPVWVTEEDFARKLGIVSGKVKGLNDPEIAAFSDLKVLNGKVNIGSFLFPSTEELKFDTDESALKNSIKDSIKFILSDMTADEFFKITKRMAVCHPDVFPLIADTAMEVRTSVTIDPRTGAAEKNKLFTYEAVPAGAIFQTDLNFLGGKFPDAFREKTPSPGNAKLLFEDIEKYGFPYLSMTGMGGNVTRGFGRVRFLGYWKKEEVVDYAKS